MAQTRDVLVPDFGEAEGVTVAEVLVAPGSVVSVDTPILVLESDKASMEVPSPAAGTVREVLLSVGDPVVAGTRILTLDEEATVSTGPAPSARSEADPTAPAVPAPAPAPAPAPDSPAAASSEGASPVAPHASPAIRRLARELGVNLADVRGSGPKGRITKDDVQQFVKQSLAAPPTAPRVASDSGSPGVPTVDFSRFGPVERKPLGKIRRSSAARVLASWQHVPHVTQFDEADITELDSFRKAHSEEAERKGFKLTIVAFVVKAVARALAAFPELGSSLDPSGEALVVKKYVNVGVAVDTPSGLVVPVLRDVDCKGVFDVASELAETSQRARDSKLVPADLQGGCFTVTSLGGIGGTAFTPIVNAPEVAILGLSRASMKPVWRDGEFVPRLLLPLSLSYDHRVIDGAMAARFVVHLCDLLADIRGILL